RHPAASRFGIIVPMSETFEPSAFNQTLKQSWSSVSEHYDRMSAELFPPITSAFLSFVQLRPGQLALDVACGPGTLTKAVARAVACLVQGSPERMLFTSLLLKTMVRLAPELKQPGSPGLYAFAPVGVLDQEMTKAGLWQVVSSRMSGVFSFPSPEAYWETLTA